jgi:hypothetical protein
MGGNVYEKHAGSARLILRPNPNSLFKYEHTATGRRQSGIVTKRGTKSIAQASKIANPPLGTVRTTGSKNRATIISIPTERSAPDCRPSRANRKVKILTVDYRPMRRSSFGFGLPSGYGNEKRRWVPEHFWNDAKSPSHSSTGKGTGSRLVASFRLRKGVLRSNRAINVDAASGGAARSLAPVQQFLSIPFIFSPIHLSFSNWAIAPERE